MKPIETKRKTVNVKKHIRGMKRPEAVAHLLRLLDRSRLFTVDTERRILAALPKLYDHHAEPEEAYAQQADIYAALAERGYAVRDAVQQLTETYAQLVQQHYPKAERFSKYESRSSFFGCGYEDVTWIYRGYDHDGYRDAQVAYGKREGRFFDARRDLERRLDKTNAK